MMTPMLWFTAGAATMYFLDPEQGRRRRALMRDKLAWLRDEYGDLIEASEGKVEHLRNRAKGVLHETRSRVEDSIGATRDAGARTSGRSPATPASMANEPERAGWSGSGSATESTHPRSNATEFGSRRAA